MMGGAREMQLQIGLLPCSELCCNVLCPSTHIPPHAHQCVVCRAASGDDTGCILFGQVAGVRGYLPQPPHPPLTLRGLSNAVVWLWVRIGV